MTGAKRLVVITWRDGERCQHYDCERYAERYCFTTALNGTKVTIGLCHQHWNSSKKQLLKSLFPGRNRFWLLITGKYTIL